jgi:hypothetical protein
MGDAMTNKEYLAKLSEKDLAELLNQWIFQNKVQTEFFCRGVCPFADEKGFCTHFNAKGEVDCPWTSAERIEKWLQAEHK